MRWGHKTEGGGQGWAEDGGGGNLQALGQGVVHAGRRLPIRPPPTAGAAGSTPGSASDPPRHGPCGGPQPDPCPEPPNADA